MLAAVKRLEKAGSGISRGGEGSARHSPLDRSSSGFHQVHGSEGRPCQRSIRVQPKLTVGSPDDPFEREADRIAGAVMRIAEPRARQPCPCGGGCPKCQTEQPGEAQGRLQPERFEPAGAGETAAPAIVYDVLQSSGRPLDVATRRFFESRFHVSLGAVRVHTGPAAERLADAYAARAFTLGRRIVFNAGEYAPHTPAGRRLLAHELAHVQQQQAAPSLARQVRRTPYPGCDRAATGVADADDRIDRAREQALRMIRTARAAFPRMSGRTIRNVDRHFHCPSISQIRTIMRVLEAIEAAIPTLSVRCVDASADFCRESEYVRGEVSDGLMELCPASFRPDARTYRLAGTFIHAGAITAGMTNLCLKREPCYDDFTLPADIMVENSYSYTWFAIEQAGHDIGSPPTIPCAPLHTGENVVVPPGATTDPTLIRPLSGYEEIPPGSTILPVFTDRAGNRFIYHDNLPGAQQYLPGERKRYYFPSDGAP